MRCFRLERLKNYLNIKKWKKAYQIDRHIYEIELLFKDINGYQISKKARENSPSLALTYGEIELESFLALISLAKPNHDTIFYDLGCGLGKTVIACAKVYKIKKACGIEYLSALLEKTQAKFNDSQTIEFMEGNLLDLQWDDATLIFINLATFVPETWQLVCDKIAKHPADTIISCARPIPLDSNWERQETKVMTSWGVIPAYIHKYKVN